jgi:hypothetical protein
MSETSPCPDKSTLIRAFNTYFFDFINHIIFIFPDNQDIIISKKMFETVKRANPTAIIKIWYQRIYFPYSDVIDSGNIDFICEKKYEDDLVGIANSNEIIKFINHIRDPIKNMSDVNKAQSMTFLQNLSKLSLYYANAVK